MAELNNPTLRDLIPQPVELPVGGLVLRVAPMGWMRCAAAYDAIEPALSSMPLLDPAKTKQIGEQAADWMAVVMTHRDSVLAFCTIALAADESEQLENEETVAKLPPPLLIELLLGLLEVNLDFFVQSLPRVMERAAGVVTRFTQRLLPELQRVAGDSITTSSA